jgi:hypothetical protein
MIKIMLRIVYDVYFCDVKRISAAILLSFITLQTFYPAFITAWFYLNRSYIAQNLCVNKSRPELKCFGKCYLCKKLNEAEKSQDQESPQLLKQWVESSPCTIVSFYFSIYTPNLSRQYAEYNKPHYHYLATDAVFHPPAAAGV